MTEKSLRHEAQLFLEKSFATLQSESFVFEERWQIDHLCYRTSTLEIYEKLKVEFAKFSRLLIESEVNGRLISTYKLSSPIAFQKWQIELIELPAPKLGKKTPDGFEHFEVVSDLSFEELKKRYAQFKLDEKGLKKVFNQELEVCFTDFAVKFHHMSLETVIELEKKMAKR